MPVYVDPLFGTEWADKRRWPFKRSCHMTADTHEELESMARKLGLKPAWLQSGGTPKEHYDLVVNKRAQAIRLGAVAITRDEAAEQLARKYRAAQGERAS